MARRKPLEAINAEKAAAFLAALNAGQNLDVAMRRARVSMRLLERWLTLSNDRRPSAEPSREFAAAFGAGLQSQRRRSLLPSVLTSRPGHPEPAGRTGPSCKHTRTAVGRRSGE